MSSILLYAVLTAVLLFGCVTPASTSDKPLRTISKGSFSGIQEPEKQVIRDQATWERFWAKHNVKKEVATKRPEIDFNKEMVIAVTMGKQPTGGYRVEITKVEEANGKLQITAQESTPRPGSLSIQTLTAPFHFVAVAKSKLKPEFIVVQPDSIPH